MYNLQQEGVNRYNIQEFYNNKKEWYTYNFKYIKSLDELISYVKHWLIYTPESKFRIMDSNTGEIVYE